MPRTRIKDQQLSGNINLGSGGSSRPGISTQEFLKAQREAAHLIAVTELKDRVDGASGFFYDLFDRTNDGSIAQLDPWERKVDVLTAGDTSVSVVGQDGPGIEAGMEITIQSTSNPDVFERVSIASITSEDNGATYVLHLTPPLANDYPEGALLYRSKGDIVNGRFVFGARRVEFGAETYSMDVLPPATRRDAVFSPDGAYLAVVGQGTPNLLIYKIYRGSGNTFVKLPEPSVLPAGIAWAVAFSPDSAHLAVGHQSSPYLTIYRRDGDAFTKLPDPDVLPTGPGQGVAFSHDGNYLAVAHYGSPHLTIYKRSGDGFTKLPNPNVLPKNSYYYGAYCVAFSPDGLYLAVGHAESPYLLIYKRVGDIFKWLTGLALPYTAYSVAFSPDGIYLAAAHGTNPCLSVFKRSGDFFTQLSVPSLVNGTGDTGYGVAFSPDGRYLAVAHVGNPFLTVYRREFDTFIKLPALPDESATTAYRPAFSPQGEFLAVPRYHSPYVTVYSTDFALTPMKQIDLRYNLKAMQPFQSLVAWVERERTPFSLQCAVSIGRDGQECYETIVPKIAPVDSACDEYQYTVTSNLGTKATLRLTAITDDPGIASGIRRITGVVGD